MIPARVHWLREMPNLLNARKLADRHGLAITAVTWEDNGRSKHSVLGPCITDMTLLSSSHGSLAMPVVRPPNYEDLTWDVPMEKIQLMVGNAHGEPLRQVSLRDFLASVDQHLTRPLDWQAATGSLLAPERDAHVIMSAQACFLPMPQRDGDMDEFNVAVRHYQSSPHAPGMLVLVATNDGTSVHVTTGGVDKLWFNRKGERCPFTVQRLGAWRVQHGRADDGSAMKADERVKNAIVVVQVPLKRPNVPLHWSSVMGLLTTPPKPTMQKEPTPPWAPAPPFSFGGVPPPSPTPVSTPAKVSEPTFWNGTKYPPAGIDWEDANMDASKLEPEVAYDSWREEAPESDDGGFDLFGNEAADATPDPVPEERPKQQQQPPPQRAVENAIVGVGEPSGPFLDLPGPMKLERDARFPVRVTLQYYKTSSTGECTEEAMAEIAEQMREARRYAERLGSLVVTDHSDRTTEHDAAVSVVPPPWWPDFWAVHGPQHAHFANAAAAAAYVFKNGRFTKLGMQEAKADVLAILAASKPGGDLAAAAWKPPWGMMCV